MKFKFDENLGRAAATVLLDAGFDVVTVPEQRLEGASDHDVIECCVGEERRPALPFDELADLTHELGSLHPDREVDIAIINHADPLFLRKITERCRPLYGSPRRLAELRIYAFRRYQDHRRYLALEREYVRRTLARLSPP